MKKIVEDEDEDDEEDKTNHYQPIFDCRSQIVDCTCLPQAGIEKI
jgi:hypothetical protein